MAVVWSPYDELFWESTRDVDHLLTFRDFGTKIKNEKLKVFCFFPQDFFEQKETDGQCLTHIPHYTVTIINIRGMYTINDTCIGRSNFFLEKENTESSLRACMHYDATLAALRGKKTNTACIFVVAVPFLQCVSSSGKANEKYSVRPCDEKRHTVYRNCCPLPWTW